MARHRDNMKKRVNFYLVVFIAFILFSINSLDSYAYSGPLASGYFIQHGTTLMTAAQQNVTITPVNLSHAFVIVHQWMWQRDVPGTTATGASGNADWMMASAYLSEANKITLERSGTTDGIFVTWMVVEALNNEFTVQRGKKTLTGLTTTSTTDTIPIAVDPSKSLSWQTLYTTFTADDGRVMQFYTNITDSTTITFKRGSTTAITGFFRWVVVEWDTDKIGEIEKGFASVVGSEVYATPKTEAISVHQNQSFLFSQCIPIGDEGLDATATAAAIQDDNTLIFYTYDDDSGDYQRDCAWTIIDFGTYAGKREESDYAALSTTTYVQSNFFTTPIQVNRSLAYIYTTSDGDGNAFPRGSVFYNLTNNDITYEKRYGGQNQQVAWAVLELPFNFLPNVTNLVAPRDDAIVGSSNIDFKYIVNDVGGRIENCTLWGNFSGTWGPNETDIGIVEQTVEIINIDLGSGTYIWNIKCYDDGGDHDFYDVNYTLHVDVDGPAITNTLFNATAVNQTHSIRFNATVTDFSDIDSVDATLQYPNGTYVTIPMVNDIGNVYYFTFSDTNLSGRYNLTQIIAVDGYNNTNISFFNDIYFNVTLSAPANFDLLSPTNKTESQNLAPTMTWQESWDEHFNNYTLLIDNDPSFSSIDYNYSNIGVSNTTHALLSLLTENAVYYWRVIAYDLFGSSTISTNDYAYITDTIAPSVELNYPGHNDYAITALVAFNYTPTDTNTIDSCVLYDDFDGSFGPDLLNDTIDNGNYNYFTKTLLEGYYLWNVWCNDSAQNDDFAVSNFTIKVDLTPPNITLVSPNASHFENATNNIWIKINASDTWADIQNCDLIVDGNLEQTKTDVIDGEVYTFIKFMLNGNYTWSVNCTDTNGFESSSEERNITVLVVDANPPLVTLNFPGPNHYLPIGDLIFNYTVEDATGISNCSLYLDSGFEQVNDTPINFYPNYFIKNGISEAVHNWTVKCYDNSTDYNLGVSDTNVFTIDLTDPAVNLSTPADGAYYTNNSVLFNYTPTDINLNNCSLHINSSGSFIFDQSNITPMTDVSNYFTKILNDGTYLWNVKCYDKSGRVNFLQSNYTVKVDTTAPSFSNNNSYPIDPAIYAFGQVYFFNITWHDMYSIDSVWIEHDLDGTYANYSLLVFGNGVYSYNYTGLAAGTYNYRWHSNDTLGHMNSTALYSYAVNRSQTLINLSFNGTQGNITINESSSLNITAALHNPTTGFIELFLDGAIINNGSDMITNITFFAFPGVYNVTATYNQTQNFTYGQKTYFATVLDTTKPNVTSLSPNNNDTLGASDVTFQYIVNDYSDILNCSLYIDGSFVQSDTGIIKNITLTFEKTLADGSYNYQIKCYDSYGNLGLSQIRNFSVLETTALVVNVTTDKANYVSDFLAYLEINASDIFGNSLDANIEADIIRANTTASWWNTSWRYRKSILFSQQAGYNLTETVTVNVTGLNGNITNCTKEVRIVYADGADSIIAYHEILGGDDSTYCIVKFNAKVSANAINESKYYAYYGNLAALDPGYTVTPIAVKVQRNKVTAASGTLLTDSLFESIDPAKSFLLFSYISGDTSPDGGQFTGYLFYNQVRFSRYASSTGTVSWQVISHPDITVERGEENFDAATYAVNATLSNPVDLSKSFIIVNGRANQATAGDHHDGWMRARFINSTTITIQRANAGTAAVADWQVVEWNGASVQNGSVSFSTLSTTAGISGINQSRTFLVFGTNTDSASTGIDDQYASGKITSPTQITFTRVDNDGPMQIDYFAVELPIGTIVQQAEVTTSSVANMTLSAQIDMNNTFEVCSFDNSGNAQTFTNAYAYQELLNNNTITVVKQSSSNNHHTVTYAVEANIGGLAAYEIGVAEEFIERNAAATGIDGTFTWAWNTSNYTIANYSVVAKASLDGFDNGTGASHFAIFIDTFPPIIELSSPVNAFNTTDPFMNFSWTPTDEFYQKINCTLNFNGTYYHGLNTTSAVMDYYFASNLTPGFYNWNVSCSDEKNNTNTTKARSFTIVGAPAIFDATLSDDNKSVNITWGAGVGAVSYNVYIKTNYSKSFGLAPNVTGVTDLNWTDVDAGSYSERYYKIASVRGSAEKEGKDVAGKKTVDLDNSSGWIMASFVYNITNNHLGDFSAYKNIINVQPVDAIAAIYRLNGTNGLWESVFYQATGWQQEIGSESFTSIEPGRGYWFEMNKYANITYVGLVINNTFNITLYQGWNMIGSVHPSKITLAALGNEPPAYPLTLTPANTANLSLWQYVPADNNYNYTENKITWLGWWPLASRKLHAFSPNEGYYLETTNNLTWEAGK